MTIKPGELDNLKALIREMVESTQASEPGALDYEWFFDADEKTCHIWERNANSAAAMTHLGHFGEKFAERFMAALEPTRFIVYGNPNDEVQEALSDFDVAYLAPFAGFAR